MGSVGTGRKMERSKGKEILTKEEKKFKDLKNARRRIKRRLEANKKKKMADKLRNHAKNYGAGNRLHSIFSDEHGKELSLKAVQAILDQYSKIFPSPIMTPEGERRNLNGVNGEGIGIESRVNPVPQAPFAEVNQTTPNSNPDQTTFASGARRSSDTSRYRFDLISPIGMRRLAETCAEGAEKYGEFNWERGMPISDILNHVIAHINKYLLHGRITDTPCRPHLGPTFEDHLAHAAWGLFAAMHMEELIADHEPNSGMGLRDEGLFKAMELDKKYDEAKGKEHRFRRNKRHVNLSDKW